MSDILIRKPLLVNISDYKGYYKDVFPSSQERHRQPSNLAINLNSVILIQAYDWNYIDGLESLIFRTFNKDDIYVFFENKETRDAAFQDLSKYFN